jgi:lysophospholipase L1-like esterase
MGLSMGVVLLLIEIGFRVFLSGVFLAETDTMLVRSDVPGLEYRVASNLETASIQTDEYGMRRRNGPADIDRRILLLGDSIAYASFLKYEKSFGPRLEQFLNDRMEESVGLWNAGVPGYNTSQEAVQLEVVSPKVKPELIIVQYCMNDYLRPVRLTEGGQLVSIGAGTPRGSSLAALTNSSMTYIFLKEKVKDAQRIWPEAFPVWSHYVHYLHQKEGWGESEQALLRMRQSAQKIGAQFLAVIFPLEQQLRIGERRGQDRLLEFSAANNIDILDLYNPLKARWREGLYVDYWNQEKTADKLHLNERGHEIVAAEIGNYLLERKTKFFRNLSKDGTP